jgi:hypothetical protein
MNFDSTARSFTGGMAVVFLRQRNFPPNIIRKLTKGKEGGKEGKEERKGEEEKRMKKGKEK